MKIYGEIESLKAYHKQRLLHLYESGGCSFFPHDEEFFYELAKLTEEIGKEIGVLIDKKGHIHGVFVGDHRSIAMPNSIENLDSFEKVGFLHTHPNGSGRLSQLDETAYAQLDYDWIAALGVVDGKPHSFGILGGREESFSYFFLFDELFFEENQKELSHYVWKQGKRIRRDLHETSVDEKVLMVGLELPKAWPVKESLAELAELIRTAGGQVVGTITQKRDIPEGATFIGQGKLSEVAELIQVSGATTVIFDDELNGIQQRNVEAFLGCKVLDRIALILDIFSQRARSYEGKIQVELAQLQYQLTRLTGRGISMSRLGGGIGTRGPGETKLEVDRRRIHKRISQLEGQVKEIQNHRQARREERSSKEIPVAALVGYTNAGKSTLLNYLTQAGVLAEDLLFATLDPTIRRLTFASGRSVLLSDTVGFINKLPHKLIHAFKATLEEVKESTILLQLIDVSDENWQRKQDAVQEVLTEMKLGDKERITLYNKIDLVEDKGELDKYLCEGNSFGISAVTGENLPFVLEYLESALFKGWQKKKYLFSYEEGEILHQLYEIGQIKEKNYLENGIEVIAEIPEQYEAKWLKWEKESI